MTDEQIFKKVIEKAVEGGYNDPVGKDLYKIKVVPKDADESNPALKIMDWLIRSYYIPYVIFSPDFGSAFFGTHNMQIDTGEWTKTVAQVAWQYHQHKMLDELQAGRSVFKYLERFL